jgi:acyl-CoA reductase-like NAD-dependent aldehyde dehydrogenase
MGEHSGVPVSYFSVTDSLGVILPSNSPGVNSLWLPAIPLKIPVVLKPGREDPWTPYRLIRAFIDAGCPAEAFSFYPTDHEGSGAVINTCGRILLFGDQSTVERYAADPRVEVHGPGHSKVLIGEDRIEDWEKYIEVIAASVADNGGRSCINASMVVVPRNGRLIAEALAKRLAERVPRDPDDPEACLAGFANPLVAESIDAAVTEGLQVTGADELSERFRTGERKTLHCGSAYLLPTVIYCESPDHPLARREFLCPYCSVIEVEPEQMLEMMGDSLVVTAITEDRELIQELLDSRQISRLNLGPLPTSHVEWDQPHEGNLFEFLYERRSIQVTPR